MREDNVANPASPEPGEPANLSILPDTVVDRADVGRQGVEGEQRSRARPLEGEFELRKEEIVVTAVSPGWVKTRMGGPDAPLTPRESAQALFKTITGLSLEQSGKFLGRNGDEYAW